MPISSNIAIESIPDTNNHKLEIVSGDRPGLLSLIANTFLAHEVHIQTAKINTLGKRAEDVFLISGKDGEKLDEKTINALGLTLIENFS